MDPKFPLPERLSAGTRPCPDAATLRQYLTGRLHDTAADPVAEHVLACDRCAETIDRLASSDELCASLRKVAAFGPAAPLDPAIGDLMDRLCGLASSVVVPRAAAYGDTPDTMQTADTLRPRQAPVDFLSPPQSPDELGRLGPYRVLRLLGAGGMGQVFHAQDARLGRLVALKVLVRAHAENAEARERFLREARAASTIHHDNIVTIYDIGEERGVPYLVMELLEGESLETWLKRRSRPNFTEIVRLARQIAAGLAAAHTCGVVHRDIKPANIWLEAPGDCVKILDFGLAFHPDEDVRLTQQPTILGTPAYMSPEQARGAPVDGRSDLFNLGAVIYELCTGRLPFEGGSALAIFDALTTARAERPRKRNPAVPESLDGLIMSLLQRDPARRPQSAAELVQALAEIERELGRPPGRSRTIWWLGTAGILAATLLIAFLLYPRGGANDASVADANAGTVGQTQAETAEGAVPNPLDALRRETIPALALAEAGGGDPARAPAGLVAILGANGKGHQGKAIFATVSPNGSLVASGGADSTVRIWDIAKGQERFCLRGHPGTIETLVFSPDGRYLASAVGLRNEPSQFNLWDVAGGKIVATSAAQKGAIYSMAFSPDSTRLATVGSDRTLRICDVITGKVLATGGGHEADCWTVAYSPDGTRLATGSSDRTVRVWDAVNAQELWQAADMPNRVTHLAYSANGRQIVVLGRSRSLQFLDADAGKPLSALEPFFPIPRRAAFSPDATHCAIVTVGGELMVFSLTQERLLYTCSLRAEVQDVAFAVGNRHVVTANGDGTLYVIRLPRAI